MTDLERSFYENEPPGLFPQNQDSYWGQLRKVLSDKLQEIADKLATFYLNQSAKTVDANDISEWETMLGIPVAGTGASLAARRTFVVARLERGPFTKTRVKSMVEFFIASTMGTSLSLTADGLSLDAAGLSLLDELTSLAGLYSIRYNGPYGTNRLPNGEFNTTANWAVFGTSTLTSDPVRSKFGTKSGKLTINDANNFTQTPFTIEAAAVHTASAWVYVDPASSITSVLLTHVGTFDGVEGVQGGDPFVKGQWFRPFRTLTPVASLAGYYRLVFPGAVPGDKVWIDGVQVEPGAQATSFVDPEKTPFYYEVRIKDTVLLDLAGLQRELDRITPAGVTFDIYSTPNV
jgi:hypothetical protein